MNSSIGFYFFAMAAQTISIFMAILWALGALSWPWWSCVLPMIPVAIVVIIRCLRQFVMEFFNNG